MKVIDIECRTRDGFGTGKVTTIVSAELRSRLHQVERLHGVKFNHILVENTRMRVIFNSKDESLADTRQTIFCGQRRRTLWSCLFGR